MSSDSRLRDLERVWATEGTPDARKAYETARSRVGLPPATIPSQPTGGKLSATLEYGPGLVDYWGGNGRRWSDDAGCLFASVVPGMTLEQVIDAWVDCFNDGGDWETGPDWIDDDDVRDALHAMLTPEAWARLHLSPDTVSELAPDVSDYYGDDVAPLENPATCADCNVPAVCLVDDAPLCADCVGDAIDDDCDITCIVLLEIVETPLMEYARTGGWSSLDNTDYRLGPDNRYAWVDVPVEPGDSFSWGKLSDETGEPDPDGYVLPRYMSGGDYSGSLYDRANANAFLESFGGAPCVHEVYGGHGSFGIAIRIGCVCDQMQDIAETLGSLEDYPVVDDEALYTLESEQDTEAWDGWARDEFLSELEKKYPGLNTDGCDDSAGSVREFFEACREAANEYWETEGQGRIVRIESIVWGSNGRLGAHPTLDPCDDGVTLEHILDGIKLPWSPNGMTTLIGAAYDTPAYDEQMAYLEALRDARMMHWADRYKWSGPYSGLRDHRWSNPGDTGDWGKNRRGGIHRIPRKVAKAVERLRAY